MATPILPRSTSDVKQAFLHACNHPNGDKPIDPRQALADYLELTRHGDTSAAALAIGDCITALSPDDQSMIVNIIGWIVKGRP